MALFGNGFPETRLSGGRELCEILGEADGIWNPFTVGSDDVQRAVRLVDSGELDARSTITALMAISAACRASKQASSR